MAEMLRNPDTSGAAPRHYFRKLVLSMMGVALIAWGAGREADLERQLEAAIHREVVLGDLPGAMKEFRDVASQPGVSRPVAARALLEIGECLEKSGKGIEAYNTYRKVVSEFRDQAAMVSAANTKLAAWTGPRNLDFAAGLAVGWDVLSLPKDARYVAEVRRKDCRGDRNCVVVVEPVSGPMDGELAQTFSASAYRGSTIRLRAWLRLEQFFLTDVRVREPNDEKDRGQCWVSVERPHRLQGFHDNMENRPVRSSDWTQCEITGRVDDDAEFITFGFISRGGARLWVDDISFDVVGN